MPFAFSFQFSFPGISNPFSTFTSTPSEPPVEQRSESKPRLISEAAHADSSPLFSPAPAYRRRPSPSPSPALNAPSRKRGWVPAEAEPSPATIMTASTSGFLDTPAKYRDLAASQGDDDGEEVVVGEHPLFSFMRQSFAFALFPAPCHFTFRSMLVSFKNARWYALSCTINILFPKFCNRSCVSTTMFLFMILKY